MNIQDIIRKVARHIILEYANLKDYEVVFSDIHDGELVVRFKKPIYHEYIIVYKEVDNIYTGPISIIVDYESKNNEHFWCGANTAADVLEGFAEELRKYGKK